MTDIERLRAEIQQLKQDSTIFIIDHADAISQNADLREENTELRGEIKRLRLIKPDWRAAMTENHDLWRENERLRSALEKLIAACGAGRRYEKGIGGMTIEAQRARTVIYGVSGSAVEDARDALEGEKTND
jgi:regulator of replication initiation timing